MYKLCSCKPFTAVSLKLGQQTEHTCKPNQLSSLIHMPIQSKTRNRGADFW